MPIPPSPGGPPPPPSLSQADRSPPSLSGGRSALLSDICRGTKLRRVSVVNDRSAPQLHLHLSHSQSLSQPQNPADSKTPPSEHPYFRLYQYLQHGAPRQPRTASSNSAGPADNAVGAENKQPRGGGATAAGGANGIGVDSPSGSAPPIGGLFPGGLPKLRPMTDGSSGRSPSTRAAAPRPPSHRHDDTDSPSSLPSPSSSTAPLPPQCRRGNAPSPPVNAYNREKPLPPTPPLPSKPPPSPSNARRPPTSGGNSAPSSLAPPPYRTANGAANGANAEPGPDFPQRHNSLSKRLAPSPTGHTPTRGHAPPPPPASPSPVHNKPTPPSPSPTQQQGARPPPPSREPPNRAAAPPAPVQLSPRPGPGSREALPLPPFRTHGSPSDPPSRGKPPPPPRTPAGPPPPPPPLRNGPSSPRCGLDDFESKYSFHPLDDFPPPEEYRTFTKIYPSRANRAGEENSLVSRVRGSLQCFLEKIMEGDFIKLTGTELQEPQRKRPKSAKVKPEKEALRRGKNAQKVAVLGEKDSSVRLLEELVFGSEDQLLDSLGQEEEPGSTLLLDDCSDEDEGSGDSEEEEQQPIKRAAWIDEDDDTEEQVDLTNRFRRDFIKGDESTLSKSGLQQRMREKFQSAMGGSPAWAQLHQNTAKQKTKKKEAEEDSDEDQEDLTRRTGNYITASQNLPPGVLKMKKCLNVNSARVSNDRLTSVQFHPRAQVAMMTGLDQSLSLFQVDGKSNPLIQSVFLERFPVHRASFSSDGLTVIATSFRNKLFYLYHMMEGKVTPVHSVRGLNEARVKEFSVCPVGDTVLLSGTRGYLHLLTLKTNEVVRSLKMNGEVCGAVFSPDGSRVFSSSEDGQVYVWDVSSARCLHRFTDDGCVKATSIAASPNGRYLACGSQSGVVNIYSQESCLNSSEPKPLRAVMNLLTPATTLTFNPTSEILALGSRSEDEAVRLLHVPSLSVFSNFPLSKRKVCYRVQDLAFSPNSGFLCLVNNKGHAPLYRLLHYQDF